MTDAMVKCNSGHETHRAMWECPVCVGKQISDERKRMKELIQQIPCALYTATDGAYRECKECPRCVALHAAMEKVHS